MKKNSLLVLLFLAIFAGFASAQVNEYRFPVATDRILVGLHPGTTLEEAQDLFSTEPLLLPATQEMRVQDEMIIGWLAALPGMPPPTQTELLALLNRLSAHPIVRFAHPFIATGNDLRGLTDRVVLKLKPGASLAAIQGILEQGALLPDGKNAYLNDVHYLRSTKTGLGPIEAAELLAAHPAVQFADVDYLLNPVICSNDPLFNTQWSLHNLGTASQGNGTADADMDVQEAWTITQGDPSIRVAIIDCGTDTLHPDLMPNLLPGHDATGGNSKGYPNTTYSSDAHGTNCAGIVAAKADNNLGIAGVCPECKVFPVKVFYYVFNPFGDPLPFASGTAMADAISWAWQVGEADVLSSSWGLFDNLLPLLPGGTQIVEDAIALALDSARSGKGGLLFFSSGNDGGAPLWPGRMEGCFSINATTMCDERKFPASCDGQNWEGNWGSNLDVSAPGVMISATDMTGSLGYEAGDYSNLGFGGTSAACPNAAGVMGLVLSVRPGISLEQAHFLMESTCDQVGGYAYSTTTSSGTKSLELGHGRVNAHQAVLAAQLVTSDVAPIQSPATGLSAWMDHNGQGLVLSVPSGLQGANQVVLRDIQGKAVESWEFRNSSPQSYKQILPLTAPQLGNGIYMVELRDNKHFYHCKLLIVN